MFFKIIGMLVVGFFVFIFLLGFVGQFWLRRKVGKILNEAKQANPDMQSKRNPFDLEQKVIISLIKRNAYAPSEQAVHLLDELKDNNFEPLNWYEIPEKQDLNIMSTYKDDVFAVIYDSPMSTHYELLTETVNDQILVVSNDLPTSGQAKESRIYKKYLAPNTTVGDAISFLNTHAADSFKTFSKAEFEKLFLKSHDVEG